MPTNNDNSSGTPTASPALLGVFYHCQGDATRTASIHGIAPASGRPSPGIGQNIAGVASNGRS